MAKPNTVLIRLVSSAGTGFYYVTKKNPRTQTEKLEFRKYDPVARKHVDFKEEKALEIAKGIIRIGVENYKNRIKKRFDIPK